MKQLLLLPILWATLSASAQTALPDARPGARWWWMGSAVSEAGLTAVMEEYARKGLGSLEVTPIYGVQGADSSYVGFLSPRWMELLRHAEAEGQRLGIRIDMNGGTGWPFGGPQVSEAHAASKLVVEEYALRKGKRLAAKVRPSDAKQASAPLERLMAFDRRGHAIDLTARVSPDGRLDWRASTDVRLIATFCGKTHQQVKRAAPGGEGLVVDHFSAPAVQSYLARFDSAFTTTGTPAPHNFFCDSYEVYGADWTPGFFDAFLARRGYRLEELLPQFLGAADNDSTRRVVADYRLTLGELLHDNFTSRWTAWAHGLGAQTRSQAHGSPANLIDLYAAADVPECESFGISDFGIRGLRRDSLFKVNDADLTMLKYASSAAHIAGRPLTSSETLTWLTEHFRTSLAQCKPDIDLMLLAGVNHLFFHGTPYTEPGTPWPGNLFYASVNMSPTNTIWADAGALFDYITRCQAHLQQGNADADFLVYYPYNDIISEQPGRLLLFDIHKMKQRAPRFIESVGSILAAGYDVDYISDAFLSRCTTAPNGRLLTPGGTAYKALILPAARRMEPAVLTHVAALARAGARVLFVGQYPDDVPGLGRLSERRDSLKAILATLPPFNPPTNTKADAAFTPKNSFGLGQILTTTSPAEALPLLGARPERMKQLAGLSSVRRRDAERVYYFVSALSPQDVDGWVPLAVAADSMMITNPLDGTQGTARTRRGADGGTEVYLQVRSGESLLLTGLLAAESGESAHTAIADGQRRPFAPGAASYPYIDSLGITIPLTRGWQIAFTESEPAIAGSFAIDTLMSWTNLPLPEARVNRGTARYSVGFRLPAGCNPRARYLLRLGDVRESARVRLNGREIATAWSAPMIVDIPAGALREGENRLEIDVTNLPANSIADYDRRAVGWRRFKEINMVNIRYEKEDYSHWQVMPSGLLGPVSLTEVIE